VQSILETVAVLAVLCLVLRLSLARRPRDLQLRGGIVFLNVVTGALVGGVAAFLLRGFMTHSGSGAVTVAAAPGYVELGAALARVLPIVGVALGGLAGERLFGALWRRYLRDGPAAARAWLLRLEFLACGLAMALLIRGFLR